ncbi:malto-oligosyltrehalose synthase [Trueperella sp. LYQ143]|uniref:malto-oligosyltrehalose synthase n=1 Tax=Trueperella sp. LYQ143 TaxID=3391059 RepID=UPI003982FC9B
MESHTAIPNHPHVPPANRHQPVTSYRIQLSPSFTFHDAQAIVPYLRALGVTDVFFSPILQAAPGSTHGYDVVDHGRISTELGGQEGFEAAADAIHHAGMHLIVDIVPNHMAVPTPLYHNRALWSLLRDGHDSLYFSWFDIELSDAGDGLLMPVLADRIGKVLTNGDIFTDSIVIPGESEPSHVIRYGDHVFPIRRGTESLPIAQMLDAQFYRLAYWRVANEELNYRRFFDVDTLAAINVENPEVFAQSHALIIDLVNRGYIDALRIDHPDGLADPREYLRNLAQATGQVWTVAEKILGTDEVLPSDWPCAGTTGYDALMRLQGLFTDPAGLSALTQSYVELSQSTETLTNMEIAAKRQIVETSLFAEVDRLATLLAEICHSDVRLRDHTYRAIHNVVTELVIHMDRYRAYVVPKERPHPNEERVVRSCAERAAQELEADHLETLEVVVDILLGNEIGSAGRTHEAARNEAIIRFQQVCGAVMAKGVEDTTFYRYTALTSANEVGAGPDTPTISPDDFHAFQQQQLRTWPVSMTTLTTHDTKRCEDVRAYIAQLSHHHDEWLSLLGRMRRLLNDEERNEIDGQIEMLMWQTIIGTWRDNAPIPFDRLSAYLLKAAREQKTWTTWTQPNSNAEQTLLTYAQTAVESPEIRELLADFMNRIEPGARAMIVAQKALHMTMVGVPDIYQGEEITQTSLVDPDNRRPVDFAYLHQLLARLESDGLPAHPSIDEEKLWVTSRLAQLRARTPQLLHAGYEPLPVSTGYALAFARMYDQTPGLITVALRQNDPALATHSVVLPEGQWRNVLTDEEFSGGTHPIADLLGRFSAAVCERIS